MSLGASDSVMSMVAVWFLVFPRTPIHIFRSVALITRFLKTMPATKKLANFVERFHPTVSSLYFLPFLFTQDLLESFHLLPKQPTEIENLDLSSSINHSAHAGGFVAAAIFHLCVSGPLKYKTFAFSARELIGRFGKMAAVISFMLKPTKPTIILNIFSNFGCLGYELFQCYVRTEDFFKIYSNYLDISSYTCGLIWHFIALSYLQKFQNELESGSSDN